MSKYNRYQDYVIQDGRLVGEFEQMYQDFEDPWEQIAGECWASDKALALNWLDRLKNEQGVTRVVEVGCGLGAFTRRIGALDLDVLGTDLSPTAVEKALKSDPESVARYAVADFLDFAVYRDFSPQVFVLADISWYVLDELPAFTDFLRTEFPGAYLVHLLTTYPKGRQTYGKEVFSNHDEIIQSFGFETLESVLISRPEKDDTVKSALLARIPEAVG